METMKFKSKKLKELYGKAVAALNGTISSGLAGLEEVAKMDEMTAKIESLFSEEQAPFFWLLSGKLMVTARSRDGRRDKASFAEIVKALSHALNEAPDVTVEAGEYTASFPNSKVEFYFTSPDDCMVIEEEVTETRIVTRPHPMCVAALKELEEAV
jgi:hypothetical protein